MILRLGATDLRELLFPRACVGCGVGRQWWCPDCAATVAGDGPHPVTAVPGPAVAATGYRHPADELIRSYKSGVSALRPVLAELLAGAVDAVLSSGPVGRGPVRLVPIPATRAARRKRGADVVAALAAAAAPLIGGEVWSLLRHVRQPLPQKTLTAEQRAANLSWAMVAAPPPGRARLVIVDDVCTTGATVREAVRALQRAAPGDAPVEVAAVAVTEAPGGPARLQRGVSMDSVGLAGGAVPKMRIDAHHSRGRLHT